MSKAKEENTKVLGKEAITPRVLQSMVRGLQEVSKTELGRLRQALITGEIKGLNKDEAIFYAIVTFFFATEAKAEAAPLAETLSLSEEDIKAIRKRIAPNSGDDNAIREQLLLPFEGWEHEIPTISGYKLCRHGRTVHFPTSKLAKELPGVIPPILPFDKVMAGIELPGPESEITLMVMKKTKGHDTIRITGNIGSDLPPGVQASRKITYYDRMVEDAIGNLADDGNMDLNGIMLVTPDVIYRQIYGLADGENVTSKCKTEINDSIFRLAGTWVNIDYTAQLKAMGYNAEGVEGRTIGHIIDADYRYLKLPNGTIRQGWKIKGMPKIYQYSKAINQFITVDRNVLTEGRRKCTVLNIMVRNYLIQQVAQLKEKYTPGKPNVRYDSIFEKIGEPFPGPDAQDQNSRAARKYKVDLVNSTLDSFKKAGFIIDWKRPAHRLTAKSPESLEIVVERKNKCKPRKSPGPPGESTSH